MRSLLLCLLLTFPLLAQDAPSYEILAQGPLGALCLESPPEASCPFPESAMGWFVQVRSDDATILAYTVVLKYTDKDGVAQEAKATAKVDREVSDSVFVALRVGPFRENGNRAASVEVKPLTELPAEAEPQT